MTLWPQMDAASVEKLERPVLMEPPGVKTAPEGCELVTETRLFLLQQFHVAVWAVVAPWDWR